MSIGEVVARLFSPISEELGAVRDELARLLEVDNADVSQPLSYALTRPGKQLRPALVLLIARSASPAEPKRRVLLASAIEMLHIATLLHDDVIDGSKTRRQQATVGSVFGNKRAILLGDFIYASCLASLGVHREYEALWMLVEMMRVCIEGEMTQQRRAFDLTVGEDEYLRIVRMKTAEMFSVCCRLGCLLGGLGGREEEGLSRFGRSFGCGFQIVDDILDFVGDERLLGKPTGQDLRQGIVTLPVILALDGARSSGGVGFGGGDARFGPEDFKRLQELVFQSDGLEQSLEVARGFFEEAIASLDGLRGLKDGLADKLSMLCRAIISECSEALQRFRGTQSGYTASAPR